MFESKKIIVVLPAYNAEKTLLSTYREIPRDIVDDVLLVDDYSSDLTVTVARELGIPAVVGVRQATKKIRENTMITIDGGLGTVQMAEIAVDNDVVF